jgi:hypothetical protein
MMKKSIRCLRFTNLLRRRQIASAGLVLSLFFLSGCGAYYRVTSTTDLSADFTQTSTYAWLPDKVDSSDRPLNHEIIRNNIRNYFGRSLSDRGLTPDLDTPDVLLQLTVAHAFRENVVVTSAGSAHWHRKRYYDGSRYYSPYPTSYYYKYHYAWFFPPAVFVQHIPYERGTLTLTMYDRVSKKPLWEGSASVDIYEHSHINNDIHPAVEALMKKFPVRNMPSGKQLVVR